MMLNKYAKYMFLLAVLMVSTGAAGGYRCQNGDIIRVGDVAHSVTHRCGKPESWSYITNGRGSIIGIRYVYKDRTDRRYIYLIDIIGARVAKISQEKI